MAWRHKLNPASFCPRQRQGSIPLACFLFLSTFSWARGHERLPPVSALFRGFLSRLACWASAQRRSLGATIPRKMSTHRCCTVFTEQICDESRRRPRIILSYSQGLQRRVGANLPAKTDRGSCPLAPARAKRKWTLTGPFSSKSTLTEIRQGAFGLCCVWVGVCRVNGDPCGESGLREDLCSGDDAFSREYFVHFKKKRRRQGADHPQGAEDVWVGVCPYSYRPLSFIRCS